MNDSTPTHRWNTIHCQPIECPSLQFRPLRINSHAQINHIPIAFVTYKLRFATDTHVCPVRSLSFCGIWLLRTSLPPHKRLHTLNTIKGRICHPNSRVRFSLMVEVRSVASKTPQLSRRTPVEAEFYSTILDLFCLECQL